MPPRSMNSTERRPLVVLVVDDNIDCADTLAQALEVEGDAVSRAYGGRAAVKLVGQLLPDVIVSDLEMPDISGLDEAVAIRACTSLRQPWMIALTGSAQVDIRHAALDAGFDCFMTKPTDLAMLSRVIDDFRRRGARPTGHC